MLNFTKTKRPGQDIDELLFMIYYDSSFLIMYLPRRRRMVQLGLPEKVQDVQLVRVRPDGGLSGAPMFTVRTPDEIKTIIERFCAAPMDVALLFGLEKVEIEIRYSARDGFSAAVHSDDALMRAD